MNVVYWRDKGPYRTVLWYGTYLCPGGCDALTMPARATYTVGRSVAVGRWTSTDDVVHRLHQLFPRASYHITSVGWPYPFRDLPCRRHPTTLRIVTVRRVVRAFNYAPRHGGIRWCADIVLHILILGSRERWLVSLTFRPLYPTRKIPEYLLNRKLSEFPSSSSSSLGRGRRRNFAAVAASKFPSPAIFSLYSW